MSIINDGIKDLLDSNEKYPPYGHEVYFYTQNKDSKGGYIIVSCGDENFPIELRIDYVNLTGEEEGRLKRIKLQNSNREKFVDFGKTWMTADLKHDEKYIEELIYRVFREVWKVEDLSSLSYEILPI